MQILESILFFRPKDTTFNFFMKADILLDIFNSVHVAIIKNIFMAPRANNL